MASNCNSAGRMAEGYCPDSPTGVHSYTVVKLNPVKTYVCDWCGDVKTA